MDILDFRRRVEMALLNTTASETERFTVLCVATDAALDYVEAFTKEAFQNIRKDLIG